MLISTSEVIQRPMEIAKNHLKKAENSGSMSEVKEQFSLAKQHFNAINKYLEMTEGAVEIKAEVLLNLAQINNNLAQISPKERDKYLATAAKTAIKGLNFSQNGVSNQMLEIIPNTILPLAKKYSNKALFSKDLKVCEKNFKKAKKLLEFAQKIQKRTGIAMPIDLIRDEIESASIINE